MSPEPTAPDPFATFFAEARDDGREVRRALAAAAALHVLLLLAVLPQRPEAVAATPENADLFLIQQTPRFKPSPPPPLPTTRVRRIPMPDPTPDLLEPVPQPLAIAPIELPADELALAIPETAPPLPAPPPVASGPIRVGGRVAPPERIAFVRPRYTELARKSRTQGFVTLETVIDRDGQVTRIQVLKSLPFGLTEEAVRAVSEWRFEPSTLNGEPISVIYVVTVHFRLH